jgi:hypothetical protein
MPRGDEAELRLNNSVIPCTTTTAVRNVLPVVNFCVFNAIFVYFSKWTSDSLESILSSS